MCHENPSRERNANLELSFGAVTAGCGESLMFD